MLQNDLQMSYVPCSHACVRSVPVKEEDVCWSDGEMLFPQGMEMINELKLEGPLQ